MYLFLNDKRFFLDCSFGFSEKVSQLKKKSEIKLNIYHYVYSNLIKTHQDLEFMKDITEVPDNIYISKSDYYWWVFDGCKLIDINISQDKSFYDYNGRHIKKWNCKLTFSYNDVYGSNKKKLIDRDIKLKKLFNE
jgi:hypothetical protein